MKNLIYLVIFLVLLGCSPIQTVDVPEPKIHTLYGIVDSIDAEYIMFWTDDGNGWCIDYVDGYNIRDEVIITFSDMGTPADIYDDEIINIFELEMII